jgi:hypothetical protein
MEEIRKNLCCIELGMAWLRKSNPTKGCKVNGRRNN